MYNTFTKVFGGVCGSIGLASSLADWPMCFAVTAITSTAYGDARERCASTFKYIGHGMAYRAKLVAAGAVAPFDSEKSDELYDSALVENKKAGEYLHKIIAAE